MISRAQQRAAQERAAEMIARSGIIRIREEERNRIEVVDFGQGRP